MTVPRKLLILNFTVFLSGVIAVIGAFQIQKGAKLHELNIQHLNHIQLFQQEINAFIAEGGTRTNALSSEIIEIRKEPANCLSQINWFDKAVMKFSNTYQTIQVCENDLIVADQALGAILAYQNGTTSKPSLTTEMLNALAGFQKSSDDFQPLVATTVDFVFNSTLFIFIIKGVLLILGGGFISQSISKDYVKLKLALKDKEIAEKKLEDHQFKLEEIIQKRTSELESKNAQLLQSEKLSAIGKLTASFAHEFNNPLYGVKNVLEEIKEDVPMGDSEGKLIDIALSETERMANLIKKLKTFYSTSNNELEYCSINEIITDMVTIQKTSLSKKEIELSLNLNDNLPKIPIIQDQIKQVILNILQNSVEAIGEQKGLISIQTSHKNESIEIQIADTGNGIEKHNLDMIFEPFFTTKNTANGSGLGLSISYGIIQNHGGKIIAESVNGKGTNFLIIIPIKKDRCLV